MIKKAKIICWNPELQDGGRKQSQWAMNATPLLFSFLFHIVTRSLSTRPS